MTKQEIMKEAFGVLNNFKRHRAMLESKPEEKDYHELKMFKMIDQLELYMRGLNKHIREEET